MDYKPADKSFDQLSEGAFEGLLKAGLPDISPSPGFEARFWDKVTAREKTPRLVRVFTDLGSWMPTPSLSGALAVLMIAFLVGGAGGVASARSAPLSLEAQKSSVQYLSGFREFQGIPASSISGAYLKMGEKDAPA